MNNSLPPTINFPWINQEVFVFGYDDDSDWLDTPTGEENIALSNLAHWTTDIKVAIERACFADYLEKIEATGAKPPTVPIIKSPSDIWEHIAIEFVRPYGKNLLIVGVTPEWDIDLCHEWCIEGINILHYVGQVLCYSAGAYKSIDNSPNKTRKYDSVISRLSHIPVAW